MYVCQNRQDILVVNYIVGGIRGRIGVMHHSGTVRQDQSESLFWSNNLKNRNSNMTISIINIKYPLYR